MCSDHVKTLGNHHLKGDREVGGRDNLGESHCGRKSKATIGTRPSASRLQRPLGRDSPRQGEVEAIIYIYVIL